MHLVHKFNQYIRFYFLIMGNKRHDKNIIDLKPTKFSVLNFLWASAMKGYREVQFLPIERIQNQGQSGLSTYRIERKITWANRQL